MKLRALNLKAVHVKTPNLDAVQMTSVRPEDLTMKDADVCQKSMDVVPIISLLLKDLAIKNALAILTNMDVVLTANPSHVDLDR